MKGTYKGCFFAFQAGFITVSGMELFLLIVFFDGY